MASVGALTRLSVRALRGRIALLGLFAGIFLAAALGARLVAGHGEHVEPDALFQLGGFPLVSAVLLLGWVVGRFPVIAVLVLASGVASSDLTSGHTRFVATRPVPLTRVYGARLAALAGLAFVISALLLPAFDVILLGRWAGPATLVMIAAYVIAYGGLVAFLSVLTRHDAWIALALGLAALVWSTVRRAGGLGSVPVVVRDVVTFALPPQEAFFALESAFAEVAPIPWPAFAYAVGYGLIFLVLGGVLLERREI
jgi:hypothetical protein